MCLAPRRTKRNNLPLSVEERLCLQILDGMSGGIRYRHTLKYNPHGKKGGAVVPPCDFQSGLGENQVFKGIPP